MALQTAQLKEDLKSAWKNARDNNGGEDAALDAFVETLASAFEKYIKTASVKYAGGLTAPNGPVGGTFNHTIE